MEISRVVYVRPPVEAGLPHRTFYGLLDTSRAYFLRQDPATFVKTNKGEFEVAFASHVDDILLVGDTKTLNETHQSMSQQLQYG